MESLERGNRQSITYGIGKNERKLFIEAVPQFKSLNVYDMNLQRIKPDQLIDVASQSQAEDKKQDKKQNLADSENGTKNKAGKKTKKSAGIS